MRVRDEEPEIATLIKMKPRSCSELVRECCTDSDKYMIDFVDHQLNNDVNFRAALISAAVMLDLMFFEFDNGSILFFLSLQMKENFL